MEHEFKGYALVLQDGADPLTTGGVAVAGFTTAGMVGVIAASHIIQTCLLYTSPSPRDRTRSRMPSSA